MSRTPVTGLLIPMLEELDVFRGVLKEAGVDNARGTGGAGDAITFNLATKHGDHRFIAELCGVGPETAGRATLRMLNAHQLDNIVQLGICGSLSPHLRIGDVLVADQVDGFGYNTKAAGETELVLEWQGQVFRCDPGLVRHVARFTGVDSRDFQDWQGSCGQRFTRQIEPAFARVALAGNRMRRLPQVAIGDLASGTFVVDSPAFSARLHQRNRGLLAVDEEGSGMLAAVLDSATAVRALVLRSPSDFADGRKAELDAQGEGALRSLAMANASDLLLRLAKAGVLEPPTRQPVSVSVPASPQNDTMTLADAAMQRSFLQTMLALDAVPKGPPVLNLLVVDDDPLVRRTLTRALKSRATRVCCAASAEEALDILSTDKMDLVLTDIQLDGLDGLALRREILGRWPDLPVAFMTAFASPATKEEAEELGALAFLEKPWHQAHLTELLVSLPRYEHLRRMAKVLWPDEPRAIVQLTRNQHRIAKFMADFASSDLFHRAARHKVTESVRAWSKGLNHGTCAHGAERVLCVVEKLDDVMTRLSHGQPQGLSAYLESMKADLENLHPSLRVNLTNLVPDSVDDSSQLSALLLLVAAELVDNAAAALNGVGNIWVELRQKLALPELTLKVRNEGAPIPVHVQAHMFEAGFSTKGSGRGLGLALIKELLGLFRGKVELRCVEGVELLVTVPLPAKLQPSQSVGPGLRRARTLPLKKSSASS